MFGIVALTLLDADLGGHRRVGHAWMHGVHPDTVRPQFHRGDLAQPAHAPFGRAVAGGQCQTHQAGRRRDVDDRTATRGPHRRDDRLKAVEDADQVDLEDGAEVLRAAHAR